MGICVVDIIIVHILSIGHIVVIRFEKGLEGTGEKLLPLNSSRADAEQTADYSGKPWDRGVACEGWFHLTWFDQYIWGNLDSYALWHHNGGI